MIILQDKTLNEISVYAPQGECDEGKKEEFLIDFDKVW